MKSSFSFFEQIARNAHLIYKVEELPDSQLHPFDNRNIYSSFPGKVRTLFDDGYYSESTFEAFKFIDKKVQQHSSLRKSGLKLMMEAFNENAPLIQLTPLSNESEIDEQSGYRFLFSGGVQAIRNPRGHEVGIRDDPDTCLDHLAFATLLLRRLEQAGFQIQ